MKKRTCDGHEEYLEWRRLLLNENVDFKELIRHDAEVLLKLSEILTESKMERLAELDKKDAEIESETKKIEQQLKRVCKK